MSGLYGGAVLFAAIVASLFWVATIRLIGPALDHSLHRATVFGSAASFLAINLTLILIFVADAGSGVVMAFFGLAMGLQLVAAITGFLFTRSR